MNELTTESSYSGAVGASVSAMQSREVAETQTRYLMAQRFPRNVVQCVDRIKNAFSRPGLAERAHYEYARGGSAITGPSIHAAQAIAQAWENVEFGFRELSRGMGPDGVPYSEVEAFACDLQSRVPRRVTFIARHWRDTKQGGYRLKDDRDVYELVSNQAQRRVRACILAVIPSDVIDDAMQQADATLKAKADTSPEAVAKMVAAFAALGVTREQIEKRIQRRLDAIAPAQILTLKRIYSSLRDDMSSPADWFEADEKAATESSQVQSVKAAVQSRRTKAAEPAKKAGPVDQFLQDINDAATPDDARRALDAARDHVTADEMVSLAQAFDSRWINQ